MSDEELMRIAFADKRTVQDIVRYIFELVVQKGRTDAIDELVKKLEEIDRCEYAMFSLCLVKEIAEQLKEQKE